MKIPAKCVYSSDVAPRIDCLLKNGSEYSHGLCDIPRILRMILGRDQCRRVTENYWIIAL